MVDGYFTEATKRELKKIAGGLCSKCECATEGGKSIGQAAHIKDRRKGPPGGLRFDSDMTDAQRADVTNGIWLCGNCHPPIDNGTEQLTVLELQTLKQTRARKALEQKGEKYPTHEDVLKPLQIVLGATAKIRESAISNIHQAVEHTYVQLDSRFDIQTQYSNGRSILQVTPNSHVELSFSIDNESSEFKDRLRSFKDYGTSLEIIDEITVKGSTLMEELFSDTNKKKMLKNSLRINWIHKIRFLNPETNEIKSLDDFRGNVTVGSKGVVFVGNAFDFLLSLNYKWTNSEYDEAGLTLNSDRWIGADFRNLSYFDQIEEFWRLCANDWIVESRFEIDGSYGDWNNFPLKTSGSFRDEVRLIGELKKFVSVMRSLDITYIFPKDLTFSAEDQTKISIMYNWINKNDHSIKLTKKIVIEKSHFANERSELKRILTEPIVQYALRMEFWDRKIELPLRKITPIFPKWNGKQTDLKEGQTIEVFYS